MYMAAINAQYHDYCKLFEVVPVQRKLLMMIFENFLNFWFDDIDFGR